MSLKGTAHHHKSDVCQDVTTHPIEELQRVSRRHFFGTSAAGIGSVALGAAGRIVQSAQHNGRTRL